jgi:hypothetical protein
LRPVDADDLVVDVVEDQRRGQQNAPQRRGHPPIELAIGIEGDEIAHHLIRRPADQRRGDVVAQAQDEGEQAARRDPRHRLGEIDPPEGIEGPGPQERAARTWLGEIVFITL